MEVRSLGAGVRPVAAAGTPPDETLVQLARDVVNLGASLEVPDKTAFVFNRYKRVELEEVAARQEKSGASPLVGNPGADARRLALTTTPWADMATQRRQLEELLAEPSTRQAGEMGLKILDRLHTDGTRYHLWKQVLGQAELAPRELLSELLLQGEGSLKGPAVMSYLELAGPPDSLDAIASLARQVGNNLQAQQPLLDLLAAHPATPPSLVEQLHQHRQAPDLTRLGHLLEQIDRLAAAEEEVRALAEETGKPSMGISIEPGRVVVGGVVVRRSEKS